MLNSNNRMQKIAPEEFRKSYLPLSPKTKIIYKETPKKILRLNTDNDTTQKKIIYHQTKNYMFQNSNVYKLDYLNSIALQEGKIYNLLSVNSDIIKTKKKFKCKCSKSKCNARYCECFSHGQLCGTQCDCTECQNQQPRQNMQNFRQNKGCKCSKSGCLKNYCQCYQKGQICNQKCSCLNCKNLQVAQSKP